MYQCDVDTIKVDTDDYYGINIEKEIEKEMKRCMNANK